jgi:hypothetical protein
MGDCSRDGSGVSLISKEYNSKGSSIVPCIELKQYILNARYVNVSPGKDFKISLLSKLREHLLRRPERDDKI